MTGKKRLTTLIAIILLASTTVLAQSYESSESSSAMQIDAAVMAGPENLRDRAAVLGYNEDGKLVTLRPGHNNLVCLADNPEREGFSVACYHKDLEPLMARGRELRAEGKEFKEVREIRGAEVEAGSLKMPDQPTTVYILSGEEARYNPETGEVEGARLRFVVYVPYATQESTGLPLAPTEPGEPWLMDAGSHRAHIMITPPGPE